jgi:hypothetical protein
MKYTAIVSTLALAATVSAADCVNKIIGTNSI